MVRERLQALGHDYGDFDAHNGLWEMAEKTAHAGLERMALVPRVLEARGLDVTPGMIVKLRSLGDATTADILDVILREEVAHVAAGSRWYRWHCERAGLEPRARFRELLREYASGVLHKPFNTEARLAAGFDAEELESLLADDLDYCNFAGECNTKTEYVGEVKSGALKYKSIEGQVDEAKVFADTAAVRGRVSATATRGGVERSIKATYLAVLAWRDGRWQLTNWHTTLLDMKQTPQP